MNLPIYILAVTASVNSLFDQSIGRLLESRFRGPEVSYILSDAHSGTIIASKWDAPNVAVSVGSLLKPFTALAFGQSHGFRYPEHECRGERDACWLPRGHGRVGIEQAVAGSCNAYFRALAAKTGSADVAAVSAQFGIEGPSDDTSSSTLIGLGEGWRVAPSAIARAYSELVRREAQPGYAEIIRGMRVSARSGTGRAVGAALGNYAALAKTGTAPCVHSRRAPGDGYVVALYPAEAPRLILLLRVHGRPGAEAAAVAGQILRTIIEGK